MIIESSTQLYGVKYFIQLTYNPKIGSVNSKVKTYFINNLNVFERIYKYFLQVFVFVIKYFFLLSTKRRILNNFQNKYLYLYFNGFENYLSEVLIYIVHLYLILNIFMFNLGF